MVSQIVMTFLLSTSRVSAIGFTVTWSLLVCGMEGMSHLRYPMRYTRIVISLHSSRGTCFCLFNFIISGLWKNKCKTVHLLWFWKSLCGKSSQTSVDKLRKMKFKTMAIIFLPAMPSCNTVAWDQNPIRQMEGCLRSRESLPTGAWCSWTLDLPGMRSLPGE